MEESVAVGILSKIGGRSSELKCSRRANGWPVLVSLCMQKQSG